MSFSIDNVSKIYQVGAAQRVALQGASLTIGEQEFVSIVGPSGCGKSTLLMIMAGLLEPSGGTVLLDGTPVTEPRDGLSVVFQDYRSSLFPWMTVGKNVAMALRPHKLPAAEVKERVQHALESVGLPDAADLLPQQMSGGMQQRAAIARALVTNPSVMLMDEPLAAVDAQTRADLEDLVLKVRSEYKITVVLVTHDIDEAVYLADRCVVLAANPGRVLAEVAIPLDRPRDQVETKRDPRFVELRTEIFELVMRRKEAAA